jgi:hypothetical protein
MSFTWLPPDVLALYQVKQILSQLQQNDYSLDRVRLILNRSAEYEDKIVAEEAQRMLGIPAYFSLPNDYSGLTEAYASGNLPGPESLGRQVSPWHRRSAALKIRTSSTPQSEPWYRSSGCRGTGGATQQYMTSEGVRNDFRHSLRRLLTELVSASRTSTA